MIKPDSDINPKINHATAHTYAIIDCGHFDHIFYRNLRRENIMQYKSLFSDTPDEKSIVASPVLLQLDLQENANFVRELKSLEMQYPAVIWLWSEKNFDQVFKILKPLQYGTLESGEQILCRYFDPRCLTGFLDMFRNDQELSDRISSIISWAYRKKNGSYQYL